MNNISIGDTLSSIFEIEELLQSVQEAEENIQYLQDLKKYRDKIVADQVSAIKAKIVNWRQVILNTMETHEPGKKTLPFPGVGKVTRRKISGSWSIDNQDLMLEHLDRAGMKDDVIEKRESINQRKLKSVLDHFDKQNQKVPGVSRGADREGLSIAFEDEDASKSQPLTAKKSTPVNLDALAV